MTRPPEPRRSVRGQNILGSRRGTSLRPIRTCALSVLVALLGPTLVDAQPAPNVLAQLERIGGRGQEPFVGIRILSDGVVERFTGDNADEIGRLSTPAVERFRRMTDAMTPTSKLLTDPNGPVDGPTTEYRVRNKAGEVVFVGQRGQENKLLLQGGAMSIMGILDGFLFLVIGGP